MNGDWGLGIGDWGLGDWPNPQSPIPNPQSPIPINIIFHIIRLYNIIMYQNNFLKLSNSLIFRISIIFPNFYKISFISKNNNSLGIFNKNSEFTPPFHPWQYSLNS